MPGRTLASLNRRVLPGDEAVNVDAWLETYNGGLSSGVINTGKAIKNASYPKEWNDDPYVLAPNASTDLRVDTLVTGTKYPTLLKGEGAIRGDGVNEADDGGVSARLEAYEQQVKCRRKRWRRQAE